MANPLGRWMIFTAQDEAGLQVHHFVEDLFHNRAAGDTAYRIFGAVTNTIMAYPAILPIAGGAIAAGVGALIGHKVSKSKLKHQSLKHKEKEHSSLMPYVILITSLIFVFVVMSGTVINSDIFKTVDSLHLNSYENITAFGKGIYIKYVWGFEVLSLLLTAVIAGFTIFKNEKRQIGNER